MKRYVVILLVFTLCAPGVSGQRTISGRITDATNHEPISGVSVFLANTTTGVASGLDGYYKINIPGEGSYRLVVSHVGFQPFLEDHIG